MTYYFPLSVDLDRQSGSEMADTGDTKPLGNGTNSHSEFEVTIKGLRPVLEGFVVPMHEGACETGSQIPRA